MFSGHLTSLKEMFIGDIRGLKVLVHMAGVVGGNKGPHMYINSGRGRKSGGAHATAATPSLTPLEMLHLVCLDGDEP